MGENSLRAHSSQWWPEFWPYFACVSVAWLQPVSLSRCSNVFHVVMSQSTSKLPGNLSTLLTPYVRPLSSGTGRSPGRCWPLRSSGLPLPLPSRGSGGCRPRGTGGGGGGAFSTAESSLVPRRGGSRQRPPRWALTPRVLRGKGPRSSWGESPPDPSARQLVTA